MFSLVQGQVHVQLLEESTQLPTVQYACMKCSGSFHNLKTLWGPLPQLITAHHSPQLFSDFAVSLDSETLNHDANYQIFWNERIVMTSFSIWRPFTIKNHL